MKKIIVGQPLVVSVVSVISSLELRVRFCRLILLSILCIPALPSFSVAAVTITHYFIPDWSQYNDIQRMESITTGPDDNLWFGINNNPDAIGRMTLDGTFTIFPTPRGYTLPYSITSGPDGNLWFVEASIDDSLAYNIGRITPEGVFTEFALPKDPDPNHIAPSEAFSITSGPDGNLWFTANKEGINAGTEIVRITPTGDMSVKYSLPAGTGGLNSITLGPDDNLWFTDSLGNNIGRMTLTGVVTLFHIPTANSKPMRITASPDGNLWFTENGSNQIGQITPEGYITEYPIATAAGGPYGIIAGPDGNIWFTEQTVNKIGHTPISASNEYQVYDYPMGITVGPDGNIWVANSDYIIDQVSGIGAALPLRLIHFGNPVNTYSTFQEAYTAASAGDIIQAQAIDLTGPLVFTRNIDVTFEGGYDSAFILNTRSTTVKGSITIEGGKATVEKVVIK